MDRNPWLPTSRRDFLKSSAGAAALPFAARSAGGPTSGSSPARRPNIVLVIADQFRWDFVGAQGLNPSTITKNLDGIAARGVNFSNFVTTQPVCAPSRSCMFTGHYASQTGVWRNGLPLRRDLPTLATVLRAQGYTANYVGKWHLAGNEFAKSDRPDYVPPELRGGFLDLWDASEALELSSHPYSGVLWDRDGNKLSFEDEYRVDYVNSRAIRFLKEPQEKPFLLVVSQLEPHFQNDLKRFVAPRGYAERFANAWTPRDLRPFPGDWPSQLPDYYGAIQRVDESVGQLLQTLRERHLDDNTIVAFVSDHGCHFRTRNTEYKRSPHESSIHVPLLMQGPGLDLGRQVTQLGCMIDLMPTLLDAAGIPAPAGVQGRSMLPLLHSPEAREQWQKEVFIQISESCVGRALRTDRWTYCVIDPEAHNHTPNSSRYQEYQLYDLAADPHQIINMAGRSEYRAISAHLRQRLLTRIQEAGEPAAEIAPARFYA